MTGLVLADDHTLFADALAAVLTQDGFPVHAVVPRRAQLAEAVGRIRPDLLLLDRYFGDGDALDVLGDVRARSPRTKVVMLTAAEDPEGVRRALRAGAVGYLQKTCGVAALFSSLRRIVAGEIVIQVAANPDPRRDRTGVDVHRLASHLTARERECLAMLVEGLCTTGMVQRMGVSRTTVRTHVQALLTKLGVHSRLEAASVAVRYSLLDPVPLPDARPRQYASM